jgi:hypothetical protein
MHRILFSLFLFSAFAVSAQSRDGDLRMQKSKIFRDDTLLKPKDVLRLMEPVPEAHAAYKKAKANYNAGQVIGFIGGFMIGYPLGTAIAGGDPQWGVLGGGVGLLLLCLPLNTAYKKHSKNAIELYNGDPGSTARRFSVEFMPTVTGAKVALRF